MRIAVLGTGLMGAPMARNLAAGHDVVVWNRDAAKAAALADCCTVAPTPAAAASGADCVVAMLLDGPVTRAVLTAEVMDAMAQGGLVINMASADPATDLALADIAAARGLDYLDAPVSGGEKGAIAGALVILAGGTQAAFDRAAPVFARLGRATLLGGTGAGQVAKLANQLIVGTTIGAVAEALHLAAANGCDPAALRDALRGGFADSRVLDVHGARMIAGDFRPGARASVQLKDMKNVMAQAALSGLSLPLAETATAAFDDFVTQHQGGERDQSAYFEWLALRAAQAPA